MILAYTPYHAILATAVLQNDQGENHLVIVRDFAATAEIATAVAGAPFVSAVATGGCYGISSRLQRQFRYRRSAAAVAAHARAIRPDEIWVGNDARPESHAAFRAATVARRPPAGVFVEDGMTAYAISVSRPLTALENAAGRVLFGRDWCGISVLGTSGLVARGVFVHPALVRPELAHLPKTAVEREALFSPQMRRLAGDIARVSGADPERVASVTAVLTATHSSTASRASDYRAQMHALVEQLLDHETLAVKYHPRQAEPDYLGLARDRRVVLLPRGLPLECMYVLAAAGADGRKGPSTLRLVIGDVSTTLLSARWLVPDARVVSLGRPLGLLAPDIEALFSKLGIAVPTQFEGIC
jgi:hypothetical protein